MKALIGILLLAITTTVVAQKDPEIVRVIDDLTVKWDQNSLKLRTYQDIMNFCKSESYKKEVTDLLDDIHHWDTTLYFIVKEKFDTSKDKEAEATLEDIEKLETDYTTQLFKQFILEECELQDKIEREFNNETPKEYEKDVKQFEKELVKYINSITYRIDIIDEHIHHLKWD